MVNNWSPASCRPGAVVVYDAETGREVFSCKDPDGGVYVAVFSPDGKRLASLGDKGIRIWDVATHEPVAAWPSEFHHGNCLVYSPDGRHLAKGGIEGTAEDLGHRDGSKGPDLQGALRENPRGGLQPGRHAAGHRGADGTLRVWDITGPEDAAAISRPESESRRVIPDLSPDGRSLFTSPASGRKRRASGCGTRRQVGCAAARSSFLSRGSAMPGRPTANACTWRMRGRPSASMEAASGKVIRRFQVDAEPKNYVDRAQPRREMVRLLRPGRHASGCGTPGPASSPARSRGSSTTRKPWRSARTARAARG